MQFHLVVVRPFGAYAKGVVITDQSVVAEVLAGENAADVVRIVIREG